MQLKQIGVIHSPYQEMGEAPFQGRLKQDLFEIEVFSEYAQGLKDVENASHLIILFWCHKAKRDDLIAYPPWDNQPHGVFATRTPHRPNPIALDIVDLVSRESNKLIVRGMDALDNSPLLDIKPYNCKTDAIAHARLLWLDRANRNNQC